LGLFAKCSLFSKLPIIEELALGLKPNSHVSSNCFIRTPTLIWSKQLPCLASLGLSPICTFAFCTNLMQ